MKNTGIFFGSSTGTTDEIAHKIAEKLGIDDSNVHDISSASASDADAYEVLLLGSSTWGDGELQDDWFDFIEELKDHLSGKEVGFFGCGDSASYSDTFCDAVGILYEEVQSTGATTIGSIPTDGYNYDASKAEVGGKFIGLLIDEVNEDDQTDQRIETWVSALSL